MILSFTWIDHQAQRAITFKMRDRMNDFLRQLHVSDEQDRDELSFVSQLKRRIFSIAHMQSKQACLGVCRNWNGRSEFALWLQTEQTLRKLGSSNGAQPSMSQAVRGHSSDHSRLMC